MEFSLFVSCYCAWEQVTSEIHVDREQKKEQIMSSFLLDQNTQAEIS